MFLAAIVGTISFVCGVRGYLWGGEVKNILLRAVLFVGGGLMIMPGLVTDLIGLGMLAAVIVIVKIQRKGQNTQTPAVS